MFTTGDKVTVWENPRQPRRIGVDVVSDIYGVGLTGVYCTLENAPGNFFNVKDGKHHTSGYHWITDWVPENDTEITREQMAADQVHNLIWPKDHAPEATKGVQTIDGRQNGKIGILDLLVAFGLVDSYEDAARLIIDGRVMLDDTVVCDPTQYPDLRTHRAVKVAKPQDGSHDMFCVVPFVLDGPIRIPITQ